MFLLKKDLINGQNRNFSRQAKFEQIHSDYRDVVLYNAHQWQSYNFIIHQYIF